MVKTYLLEVRLCARQGKDLDESDIKKLRNFIKENITKSCSVIINEIE